MFKSKFRPIVITQYEHQRLSGTLAARWGNNAFERPALDFPAFVEGVALHDWAYVLADNLPITELSEEAWLAVAKTGLEHRFENPTTDIVVKFHIRRLLSYNPADHRAPYFELADAKIAERLPETGKTREEFERADRITELCDMVAFDFSFEAPKERTLSIFPHRGSDIETIITYIINPGGVVTVDPWPFATPQIEGILVGFELAGYPDILVPKTVPYRINPLS